MKIGVVGSGGIVRVCVETIRQMEQVQCTAICVRPVSAQRGKALAEEFGIEELYTSYEEFLEKSQVDFVYIGVINGLHAAYTKQALDAGKNVILEKPFTPKAQETGMLAALAREQGLFLFEAITTLHCPLFRMMEQRLGELGPVRMVQCNFSQYSSRYDRYLAGDVTPVFDPEQFGGTLYDINIYNIHLVTKLFGKPQAARYRGNTGFNGVDTSGVAVLEYPGFTAVCCGAKDSASPGFALVQGEKGYLHMKGDPNACPTLELMISGKAERFEDDLADRRMTHELAAFEKMWREKDYGQCHSLLDHSVSVMEIMDQLLSAN